MLETDEKGYGDGIDGSGVGAGGGGELPRSGAWNHLNQFVPLGVLLIEVSTSRRHRRLRQSRGGFYDQPSSRKVFKTDYKKLNQPTFAPWKVFKRAVKMNDFQNQCFKTLQLRVFLIKPQSFGNT